MEWKDIVVRKDQPILISSYFYVGACTPFFRKALNIPIGIDALRIMRGRIQVGRKYFEALGNYEWKHYATGGHAWFSHCLQIMETKVKALLSCSQELEDMNVTDLSKEELLQLFNTLSDCTLEFGPFLYFPLVLEKQFEEQIRALLKKKGGKPEDFALFTTPIKYTADGMELLNLLSIATKKLSEKEEQQALAAHTKEFAWLGCPLYLNEPWSQEHFKERLEIYKRQNPEKMLREMEIALEENEERCKKRMKQLGFSEEDKQFVWDAKELVYLRTYRMEIFRKSGFLIRNFLAHLTHILGSDVLYFTYAEIQDALSGKGKLKKTAWRARKAGWGLLIHDGILKVLHGKALEVYEKKEGLLTLVKNQPLQGQVAFPGKVRGTVKIILQAAEFQKMKEGDVLVTSMTTPNFMHIIHQASALITDEGGILCHAAIISRELKLPCIIGTKLATQVLKDGDRVELNANEGVVRILKRKK